MARTIRRKHYERELGKVRGSKTALTYTEYDVNFDGPGNGHHWELIFREPTQDERKREYLWRHTDKWCLCHRRSFGAVPKIGRKIDEHAHRAQCSAKIKAYMHGLSDDVVLPKLEKNHSRWW